MWCRRLQDAGGVRPDGEDLRSHEGRLHGARLLQQLQRLQTPQERLPDAAQHVSEVTGFHLTEAQKVSSVDGGRRMSENVVHSKESRSVSTLL